MALYTTRNELGVDVSALFQILTKYCSSYKETENDACFLHIGGVIQSLTSAFKRSTSRESVTEERISILVESLVTTQNCKSDFTRITLSTEFFRCFRNLCADSKRNQDLVMNNERLFTLTVSTVSEFLAECPGNVTKSDCDQYLQCAIQFCGNLIVNNNVNKQVVWSGLCNHLEKLLNRRDNDILLNYTCMVLQNCLRNQQCIIDELMNDTNLFSTICPSLVNVTLNNDTEWSLYCLQTLLEVDNFLEKMYSLLLNEQRLLLLEIVKQSLATDKTSAQMIIHPSNVSFLAEEFKRISVGIFSLANNSSKELQEPMAVTKMLDILCAASVLENYQKILQKDCDLLAITVYLLKSIHLLGKSGNNNFTPIAKLSAVVKGEIVGDDCVYGFKRDLVRLIGNLCWKCKRNQDHFREMEAIPLLLDCCTIDAQNPFIIQWVVFAVRNICEGNAENQAVIAAMESMGTIQSQTLDELGVKIVKSCKENDGEGEETVNEPSLQERPLPRNNTTTLERNLKDIKDLFM